MSTAVRETQAERDNHPCYIARHTCGSVVYARVDDPKRAGVIADEIADCIKSGYPVERMSAAEVRAQKWCSCFDKKRPTVEQTALL